MPPPLSIRPYNTYLPVNLLKRPFSRACITAGRGSNAVKYPLCQRPLAPLGGQSAVVCCLLFTTHSR
jgi:hypothetical protein